MIKHRTDSLAAMRQDRPTPTDAKLAEVAAAAGAAIFAGVDVDGAHYSLTANDQLNIVKGNNTTGRGRSIDCPL